MSTNDKLNEKAKMLIKRREALRKKSPKEERDTVELGELRKTIKKEIRKNIKDYGEKLVCEIIEECAAIKKLGRNLSKGRGLSLIHI